MNPIQTEIPVAQPLQIQPRPQRDYFSGLRKAYNGILSGLSSNNVLALLICGAPFYYGLGFSIYGTAMRSYAATALGGAAWAFMTILLIAWILAAIAVRKTMPNLLSVSVFIYTTMGHWCLVSGFIVAVYVSSMVPFTYTSYLLSAFLPSILFLIFCGDVLRALRRRMYEQINPPTAAVVV
jgi:hypothetical protein